MMRAETKPTPFMSRGMQLEAAVDKLPGWYFGDDDVDGEEARWRERNLMNSTRKLYGHALDYSDPLGSVSEDTATHYQHYQSRTRAAPLSNNSTLGESNNKPAPYSNTTVSVTDDDDDNQQIQDQVEVVTNQYEVMQLESITKTPKTTKTDEYNPLNGGCPPLSGFSSSPDLTNLPKTPPRSPSRLSTVSSSCTASNTRDLVVSGYTMRGQEKKVMYHIDVVNHESQLQTYTIRRSYSDFKLLHMQLSEVLEARQDYYKTRAQARQARMERERASLITSNISNQSLQQNDTKELALETSILAFQLPSLPSAGFLSFWKRHDRTHLQHRCDAFQQLLRAVMTQRFLRESFAMQRFLSVAPSAIRERGSSYVSLSEYSVPHIDQSEEHRERKRRAREQRRNSSASSTPLVEF